MYRFFCHLVLGVRKKVTCKEIRALEMADCSKQDIKTAPELP